MRMQTVMRAAASLTASPSLCLRLLPAAALVTTLTVAALAFVGARPALAQTPLLSLSADDASDITVAGGAVTGWINADGGQVFSSSAGQQPLYVADAVNGLPAVQFNGADDDVLRSIGFGESAQELTIFIVAAPQANTGGYNAFFSAVDSSTPGHQDYSSGINIDQGVSSSSSFDTLNLEGAKGGGGGGVNLLDTSTPFGAFSLTTISYGDTTDSVYLNNVLQGSRAGNTNTVSLQDLRIGARYYDNGGGPYETGYFTGDIAEVLVYGSDLSDAQRQTIDQSLINKYDLPGAAAAPEPPSSILLAVFATPLTMLFRLRRGADGRGPRHQQISAR